MKTEKLYRVVVSDSAGNRSAIECRAASAEDAARKCERPQRDIVRVSRVREPRVTR